MWSIVDVVQAELIAENCIEYKKEHRKACIVSSIKEKYKKVNIDNLFSWLIYFRIYKYHTVIGGALNFPSFDSLNKDQL